MGISEASEPPDSRRASRPPSVGDGGQPSFRQVLGTPRFFPLFAAGAVSRWGDNIARVTLAAVVFERTGSAMATGITFAVSLVPSVFGRSLLGPLVDRMPVRRLLILAHLLRAACVAVLIGLVAASAPVWALLLAVFVLEMLGGPASPADMVLLTQLFTVPRFYGRAMALTALSEQVNQAVGFALGGTAVALLGPRAALGVDLLSFLVGAVVVRLYAPGVAAPSPPSSGLRGFARELTEAGAYLVGHRVLLPLVVLSMIASVAIAAPEAAAIPYAAGRAQEGGLLMGSLMAGATLGLVPLGRLPVERSSRFVVPMALLMPVPLIATAWHPPVAVTALLWLTSGALQSFMLPLQTVFALLSPAEYRGRLFGFAGAASMTAGGIAFVVTGWLAEYLDPGRAVAILAGAALACTALLALCWPREEFDASVVAVRST